MRLTVLVLFSLPMVTAAQPVARPDTLELGALRAAAVRQDPRAVQTGLIARAARLRLEALRTQRLPQFTLAGQAAVQNEVPEIPVDLPGQGVPSPPREQYRAQLEADWLLYDGGRTRRQAAAERARMAEDVAGVAVTLYALREATMEAFFSALLSEAQARTLALSAEDLEARLRIVREQAEAGTVLAAEAAVLEAELIRVRQQAEESEAARRAALGVLAELTELPISPSAILVLPDLDAYVSRALLLLDAVPEEADDALDKPAIAAPLGRPELVQLARAAERAEAEARAREAQMHPSLSLFGEAGVGRPSPFNFLSKDVAEYGLIGVRLRWSIFDWGRARREAEAIRVQARLAETEAAAFARRIAREIKDERANLARLDTTIVDDVRVVALREEALGVAGSQLEEGVLLPDTYTDRLTDLAEARLTFERHRIERAWVQARLLSTLGRYPEPRLLPAEATEDLPSFEG